MVDLMGYSVLVDNNQQAEKLQEIAISQGFEWRFGGKGIKFLDERSFQFGYEGKKVITRNISGEHYQSKHITKKAHFNDLFKTEFIPTAMKCTQEQFDAIRPKLKGCAISYITDFNGDKYLINHSVDVKLEYYRTVHEEWDEEIFLKACGIEVQPMEEDKGDQLRKEAKERGYTSNNFKCLIHGDSERVEDIDKWHYEQSEDSLFTMPDCQGGNVVYKDGVWAEIKNNNLTIEQQLEKAKAEVERLEKEIENNKIKVGDWVKHNDSRMFKVKENMYNLDVLNESKEFKKIINPKLIELLENEMK